MISYRSLRKEGIIDKLKFYQEKGVSLLEIQLPKKDLNSITIRAYQGKDELENEVYVLDKLTIFSSKN